MLTKIKSVTTKNLYACFRIVLSFKPEEIMRITPLSNNIYQNKQNQNIKRQVNFTSAIFSFAAMSDSHGDTNNLPKVELAINDNYKKIFNNINPLNPKDPVKQSSIYTAFMHCGDFLVNGAMKGYKDITKCSADYQFSALEKISDILGQRIHQFLGENVLYKKYLALGNHDFDGGDNALWNYLKNSSFTTITTNIDLEKSPKVKKLINNNKNIKTEEIISIPDDKNDIRRKNGEEELFHKIMVLGITIPSIPFYNPTLTPDTHFLDECDKKDIELNKNDLAKTLKCVDEKVRNFKKENPKGVAIVMAHTGSKISYMLWDAQPESDFILTGHDHENTARRIGKTTIQTLGHNNERLEFFKLFFNDFHKDEKGNIIGGDLSVIDTAAADTTKYTNNARTNDTEMQRWLNENLAADNDDEEDPAMWYNCPNPKYSKYKTLKYNEHEVRSLNSPLANFLTSAIASEIRKISNVYGDDIASVAIQSSVIRGGIKEKMSSIDAMGIFGGLSESLSTLSVGEVSGEELAGIIAENIYGNLESDRNSMLQWSDVRINKDMLKEIKEGTSDKSPVDAIELRDLKTEIATAPSTWNKVEPYKMYKIVLPTKYLLKHTLKYVPIIKDRFKVVDDENYRTMSQLLRELHAHDGSLSFRPKAAEERVIFHEVKEADEE